MKVHQTSKLTTDHLTRQAFVYVRQSTMQQVREHQESRRRQYEVLPNPWATLGYR